jgi:hypothetical protein
MMATVMNSPCLKDDDLTISPEMQIFILAGGISVPTENLHLLMASVLEFDYGFTPLTSFAVNGDSTICVIVDGKSDPIPPHAFVSHIGDEDVKICQAALLGYQRSWVGHFTSDRELTANEMSSVVSHLTNNHKFQLCDYPIEKRPFETFSYNVHFSNQEHQTSFTKIGVTKITPLLETTTITITIVPSTASNLPRKLRPENPKYYTHMCYSTNHPTPNLENECYVFDHDDDIFGTGFVDKFEIDGYTHSSIAHLIYSARFKKHTKLEMYVGISRNPRLLASGFMRKFADMSNFNSSFESLLLRAFRCRIIPSNEACEKLKATGNLTLFEIGNGITSYGEKCGKYNFAGRALMIIRDQLKKTDANLLKRIYIEKAESPKVCHFCLYTDIKTYKLCKVCKTSQICKLCIFDQFHRIIDVNKDQGPIKPCTTCLTQSRDYSYMLDQILSFT